MKTKRKQRISSHYSSVPILGCRSLISVLLSGVTFPLGNSSNENFQKTFGERMERLQISWQVSYTSLHQCVQSLLPCK